MEKFLETSDIFINGILGLIEERGIYNIKQSSFAPYALFTLEINSSIKRYKANILKVQLKLFILCTIILALMLLVSCHLNEERTQTQTFPQLFLIATLENGWKVQFAA